MKARGEDTGAEWNRNGSRELVRPCTVKRYVAKTLHALHLTLNGTTEKGKSVRDWGWRSPLTAEDGGGWAVCWLFTGEAVPEGLKQRLSVKEEERASLNNSVILCFKKKRVSCSKYVFQVGFCYFYNILIFSSSELNWYFSSCVEDISMGLVIDLWLTSSLW